MHDWDCNCDTCAVKSEAKVFESVISGPGKHLKLPTTIYPELGGKRYDNGKPPMALIPAEAEEAEAMVWGYGAGKYGTWNWQKGMTYTRIMSCIQRHLAAIKKGEDRDAESGCLHAAHIRCNAAMLITFLGRADLDDRYKGEKK